MVILQEALIWFVVLVVAYLCLRPLVRQIHDSGSGCSSSGEGGCQSCPMMLGTTESETTYPISDIENRI